MARRTGRAALILSAEHRTMLTELVGARRAPLRELERAKVLLSYADGRSPTEIWRTLGVSKPTIYKCIDKALAAGVPEVAPVDSTAKLDDCVKTGKVGE